MAEKLFLQTVKYEMEGNYDLAITYYSKSYKLNPELEFRNAGINIVDGKEYDRYGNLVEINENEISLIPQCLDHRI